MSHMNRKMFLLISLVALIAAATAYFQVASTVEDDKHPLASVMPSGALLYLEAQDFGRLLQDWNTSPEKASWLKSDDYQVFSRSKLFLRLKDVQGEFATAA